MWAPCPRFPLQALTQTQSLSTKSKSVTSEEEWRGRRLGVVGQLGEEGRGAEKLGWAGISAGLLARRFGRDQCEREGFWSQTRCCKDQRAVGHRDAPSPATCVTLSQPVLLPGPRYSHPLRLQIRCCSSKSGLCTTRRHKAGKQISQAGPREKCCCRRHAEPDRQQLRHKQRGNLSRVWAPAVPTASPSASGTAPPLSAPG